MTPADELARALREAVATQKLRPGTEIELAASLRALPTLGHQLLQVLEGEARGPDADTSACDWLAKTLIEACGISWLEPLLALRVPYRAFDQELADTIVPAQWALARPIIARALGGDCIDLAKVIFGLLSKPLQAELFPALLEMSLTHPARDLVYLATVLVEHVAGDGDACKVTVRFASGEQRTLLARFLTRAS